MAAIEASTTELTTEVPLLRNALLRHHDLVSPDTAATSQTVVTDVGLLRLPADDAVVLPWMRRYGSWEVDESRLVDLLLPEGGVFVDIGAHVGYFTVRALRKVGRQGAVYAVEPWARVRELLELNVQANVVPAVAEALTVVDGAAWDSNGPLRLALAEDGNSGDNRIDPNGAVEVTGMVLDELPGLDQHRIDVVKCDAQGRDHRALAGMAKLLRSHRPHVVTEFWPDGIEQAGGDPAAVLRQYREWDYQPIPVTAEVVDVAATEHGRVLAENASRTDEELVDLARGTSETFLTLWLRPLV
jgi:FkbM family methyltransferase